MTPQIELLFVKSDGGNSYFPLVAALAEFPWTSDERARGIVGDCPDSVAGADIDILLARLTAEDAAEQIQYPFEVAHNVTVRGRARTIQDKPSTWGILAAGLDPVYTASDPDKPVLSADAVTAALVTL